MTRLFLALPVCAFVLTAGLASAQPAPATGDGARPGNDIGTGMSLPRSDKASNIGPGDTHSELAPNLPAPAAGESVADLLTAARAALVSGQTGAAQEGLERAETRALDRSVPYGTEHAPAGDQLVATIASARAALGRGDRDGSLRIIDGALAGLR